MELRLRRLRYYLYFKFYLTRGQYLFLCNFWCSYHVHLQAWALAGGNEEIINRFYELVPDMAIDFPFELDKFQKEVFF